MGEKGNERIWEMWENRGMGEEGNGRICEWERMGMGE